MFRVTTRTLVVLGALIALPPLHSTASACGVKVALGRPDFVGKKMKRVNRRSVRRTPVATGRAKNGRVLVASSGRDLVRSKRRDRRIVGSSGRTEPTLPTAAKKAPTTVASQRATKLFLPKRETRARKERSRPSSKEMGAMAFRTEVFFGLGQSNVDASELAPAVAWLRSHQGATLIIEGHTDRSGSAAFNRRLSLKRAKAVRSMLVQQTGVSAERIRVVGHGESRIADPENANKNRRVVIRAR